MQKNDTLWKGLIEEIFSYFIPFFLPSYAHLFDETRPVTFLDKELQELFPETGNDADLRFVDKLVKVYAKDGTENWILVHIEVQGYADPNFGKRMFTYFYRILDRYGIPVTAIAIFTDNNKSYWPSEYVYQFAGTKNVYSFNTYKVLQQEEKQLTESTNPFAVAILTVLLALRQKKLDDNDLLRLKIALVRQMQAKKFSAAITRQLFNFIRIYVNFAKPETTTKFEETISSLTKNNQTMGLEEQILEMMRREGRKEGIKEGRNVEKLESSTLFVENLLRSTDFSDEKIASLADVTVKFVQEIKARHSL